MKIRLSLVSSCVVINLPVPPESRIANDDIGESIRTLMSNFFYLSHQKTICWPKLSCLQSITSSWLAAEHIRESCLIFYFVTLCAGQGPSTMSPTVLVWLRWSFIVVVLALALLAFLTLFVVGSISLFVNSINAAWVNVSSKLWDLSAESDSLQILHMQGSLHA